MTVADSRGRDAGEALIRLTSNLEESVLCDEAGADVMALVAFTARSRRLLRAAFRSLDLGEPDCAIPLLRLMDEFLIVGHWVINVDGEKHREWALDDLRSRLGAVDAIIADADLDEENAAMVARERAELVRAIQSYGGADTPLTKSAARKAKVSPPNLSEMARAVGVGLAYSLVYRVQSQRDTHATPAALDATFERGDHRLRVRTVPHTALDGTDLYALGAHLLLDLARPLAERVSDLGWDAELTRIHSTLEARIEELREK